MRRKPIEKSIKLWILWGTSYEAPVYTSLQCETEHFCWSRLLWIACCNGLTMRGFDTNSVEAEGQCKEGRMKSALMFANQSEEIVWNWDTNTNSTANCLKHAVFNCEFISYMPPRLPWCGAFSLHKCYSVSGSEGETSMSIRLPSPRIFILFFWRCKWLNAEKDLFSCAVEGLAMNSFQAYTSCCIFQICYQLHQQNVREGIAHCADLKSTSQRPWLKSAWESAAFALMNIHCFTQIDLSPTIATFAGKHPWCLLLANILTE